MSKPDVAIVSADWYPDEHVDWKRMFRDRGVTTVIFASKTIQLGVEDRSSQTPERP